MKKEHKEKHRVDNPGELLLMLYQDSTNWFQSHEDRDGSSITRQDVYEYRNELSEMIKDAFGININEVAKQRKQRISDLRKSRRSGEIDKKPPRIESVLKERGLKELHEFLQSFIVMEQLSNEKVSLRFTPGNFTRSFLLRDESGIELLSLNKKYKTEIHIKVMLSKNYEKCFNEMIEVIKRANPVRCILTAAISNGRYKGDNSYFTAWFVIRPGTKSITNSFIRTLKN